MTSNFMIFTTGRDEITDPVRGDEDREAPDEEKDDQLYEDQQTSQPQHEKVSMFSTLTELIFNPFLDGYCKVGVDGGCTCMDLLVRVL